MANQRIIDSEEEALFRSYPYVPYFVQSPPSTISHALTHNYTSDDHLTYNSPIRKSEATDRHLALSHYSSSRGSNNSFLQEVKKKNVDHGVLEDSEKGGGLVVKNINYDQDQDYDDDDIDYDYDDCEKNNRSSGWIKYFSFSYSNSGWWIWVQLSWRLLLSLMIALAVFYVAAKPPLPKVFIKIARIGQFKLSEGVDGSGVTTKLLSCNCSMDLIIDNNSKLFGLHINPPIIEILFGNLPFAMSQMEGGELYAGSDDTTSFRLSVGTRNKAMYGAGRNMQDLLESGKGLPLVVRVRFRSSFHVVSGLFRSKSHHQAQCLVVLANKYDKKLKTQVYTSTCIINS